jgi:hypothetical protein
MDILNVNKMKKILSILLIAIIVFFVFRYCLFKVQDYKNVNRCNSSQFVADGERIYISFYRNISRTNMIKNFHIILVSKDGKIKEVNYKNNKDSDNNYYFDSKVLKSDTLIIKTEGNKRYKLEMLQQE